jgi:hypothetical protein
MHTQNFFAGGGGGADPGTTYNLFHIKNYAIKIISLRITVT